MRVSDERLAKLRGLAESDILKSPSEYTDGDELSDIFADLQDARAEIQKANDAHDEYVKMYQKLREERKEAEDEGDVEGQLTCEALMRQMRKVIAILHQALGRDPLETL